MDVTRTVKVPQVVYTLTESFEAGAHTMVWAPLENQNPRTYLIRMTVVDRNGRRTVYGSPNAFVGRHPRGPVVRIQGIDAGFARPNYAPGQIAALHIATDEPSLELKFFQSGPEKVVTYADNQFAGIDTGQPPIEIAMRQYQSKPRTITVRIPNLPSGLYYASLTGPDGRVGYAPFVVRPTILGATSRVLVVLPTNTWQAYNFQDVDGNGYGDTWYAGPPNGAVNLGRTYIARGVPPRFYRYDLPFLHWLYWSGKSAEFISDSDFDLIPNGDELAKDYDLIVFEGHEEYVATHEYDDIERFRNLGGNLMFLSANNFFWKVKEEGRVLRKVGQWRVAGRPEARLIGVQYRANDDGQKQGVFTVRERSGDAVAVGRHRAHRRLDVRAVRRRLRDRDRLDHTGFTAGHGRGRADPGPARAGDHGADELLRDDRGREGVRRRRARLRRLVDVLARQAHARQPVGQVVGSLASVAPVEVARARPEVLVGRLVGVGRVRENCFDGGVGIDCGAARR